MEFLPFSRLEERFHRGIKDFSAVSGVFYNYSIKVGKIQTNVLRKMLTKSLWNIQGIFTVP
jgi:hypothetical protein